MSRVTLFTQVASMLPLALGRAGGEAAGRGAFRDDEEGVNVQEEGGEENREDKESEKRKELGWVKKAVDGIQPRRQRACGERTLPR